ncbi:MAG TPA: hypothetical protein LFV92_04955 [Rickettsia endosymbiont of Ceroptres masudai]|nr:hypothetical protein [Rickettsia endosymbiont of Ceroptres masudai]
MFLWTPWSSELGDTVGFTDSRNKASSLCGFLALFQVELRIPTLHLTSECISVKIFF